MSAIVRLAAFFLCIAGLAASAEALPSETARRLVQETTERVLDAVRGNRSTIKTDPGVLYSLVDEIVLPHFDFRGMSMRVLGKHWRDATEGQRQQFVHEFQTLLVRSYATAIAEYSGEKISYLPQRGQGDEQEVVVRTEIVPTSGGLAVPVNYALYMRDGAWKVYDVSIDGVSLVINYRASFSGEIRQRGLDGLIARLVQHNVKTAAP
jgi:phospholipid transport system substrate-binding protein